MPGFTILSFEGERVPVGDVLLVDIEGELEWICCDICLALASIEHLQDAVKVDFDRGIALQLRCQHELLLAVEQGR